MELKYYIGFEPYFVDKGQVVDLCDNYYYSTDGKTCYGFDSEGNYYVTKRIDAVSPLVTFEQYNTEAGGINVVMSFPGEKPMTMLTTGDYISSVLDDWDGTMIFFFTNNWRLDLNNSDIKWSSFDVYVSVAKKETGVATVTKVGTTSEFWFNSNYNPPS